MASKSSLGGSIATLLQGEKAKVYNWDFMSFQGQLFTALKALFQKLSNFFNKVGVHQFFEVCAFQMCRGIPLECYVHFCTHQGNLIYLAKISRNILFHYSHSASKLVMASGT